MVIDADPVDTAGHQGAGSSPLHDIVHIDGGCEVDLSKDLCNGKRQGYKVREDLERRT